MTCTFLGNKLLQLLRKHSSSARFRESKRCEETDLNFEKRNIIKMLSWRVLDIFSRKCVIYLIFKLVKRLNTKHNRAKKVLFEIEKKCNG